MSDWTSGILVNPNAKPEPKVDPTNCSHDWRLSRCSFLVAGMVDYSCVKCKAHGWRHKNETKIDYCCGGVKNEKE